MNKLEYKRDGFGSRLGFLISTIGFSVGVGTFWRFPYVCGMNGGGLYLLTYILFMIIIGIPLHASEVSIGLASQKSPVGAYTCLSNKKYWKLAGYLNIICLVTIAGYTLSVYGWIFHYIYATVTGTFTNLNSTEIKNYFNEVSHNIPVISISILVYIGLTMLVVKNNLKNGIEKIGKILLPILVIIIIVMIINGLRFDNAIEGLKFFFMLDFENFSFNSVLSALGQAFFSLGTGMAVSLIFGSYQNGNNVKVVKNSTIVCLSVIFIAILAGMMIFPMVFAFNLTPDEGTGLTFIVMPNVFNQMKGGIFWGTLFYIAFAIAAFISGLAGWEGIIRFLIDEFNISRRKAIFITSILILTIGFVTILSDDLFRIFDLIANNYLLMIGSLLISIFVGWIWGIDNFIKISGISNRFVQYMLKLIIKYICPITIFILFIFR